jgi:hypothetical protein
MDGERSTSRGPRAPVGHVSSIEDELKAMKESFDAQRAAGKTMITTSRKKNVVSVVTIPESQVQRILLIAAKSCVK